MKFKFSSLCIKMIKTNYINKLYNSIAIGALFSHGDVLIGVFKNDLETF